MLSFALYFVGAIVVIAGLAWIATLLGAAGTIVTGTAAISLLAATVIGAGVRRHAIEPPSVP